MKLMPPGIGELGKISSRKLDGIPRAIMAITSDNEERAYAAKIRKKAIALWSELGESLRQKELEELLLSIRSAVYIAGLAGGPGQIYERAHEICEGEPEQDKSHEDILRLRTAICLATLAQIEECVMRRILGKTRARFRRSEKDIGKVRNEYFDEDGTLAKCIDSYTPLDDLFNLLALAEDGKVGSIEKEAVTEELIRRLITEDPEMIEKGARFLKLRHFTAILRQMPIGLSRGKIGKKAGKLFLAYAALEADTPEFDQEFFEQHRIRSDRERTQFGHAEFLKQNSSAFIGSGTFDVIVNFNGSVLAKAGTLRRYYVNEGQAPAELHGEIENGFKQAVLPTYMERRLKILLREIHGQPIIVRSSNELEDLKGASFAGKYESVELANSGDIDEDFNAFRSAILKVYASAFRKEVMEYRKNAGLLGEMEKIGILVQILNGEKNGRYFYPDLSVVAMSHATQSSGFSPHRGAMKIATGFGRGIVDDAMGEFVMFEKPDATGIEGLKQQREMYLIDMKKGEMQKRDIHSLYTEGDAFSCGMYQCYDRTMEKVELRYLKSSILMEQLEYIVQKLKYQFGHDVDCEFTAQYDPINDKWNIRLVQCRPQNVPANLTPSRMPKDVHPSRVLIRSYDTLNASRITNVPYILYIDSGIFKHCSARERSYVKDWVDAINRTVEKGEYIIISPRRWGSEDSNAGIKVVPHDFSNAAGVMEVFDSGTREPSFGTHFFQVVTERGINIATCTQTEMERSNFLENPSEAEHKIDLTRIPWDIQDKLKSYIRFIDVNKTCRALGFDDNAGLSGQKFVAHLAQDNTINVDREMPLSLYFALQGRDLPVSVSDMANR